MQQDIARAQIEQRRQEFLASERDRPSRDAQLMLAARKQRLLEQQFSASERDKSQRNKALKDLSNYDMATIDQAPADVLATIDENAVRSLIAAHAAKYRVDNSPSKTAVKLPTAEVQVMREIEKQKKELEQQLGRPVDYSETPLHKIIMQRAGRELSPEKIRKDLVADLIKDPLFRMRMKKDPGAAGEEVNRLLEEFFPELQGTQAVQAQPSPPSTLQSALERFKARTQTQPTQ